jgi:hypothetical protein
VSLDTYANLKTELQDWTARADISATIDTLIDLFEGYASRNLRTREMETEATTAATEYMALPDDFAEMRDIQWQGNPRVNLRYVTPEYADLYDSSGATGIPIYYTVVGNQIRLVPAPNGTTDIRISYYQRIPALSAGNTTNWLLTSYPDAYLWGSLFHGLVWAHNAAAAAQIKEVWGQVQNEIHNAGKRSNFGGSLQIRPA